MSADWKDLERFCKRKKYVCRLKGSRKIPENEEICLKPGRF